MLTTAGVGREGTWGRQGIGGVSSNSPFGGCSSGLELESKVALG